MQMRLSAFQCYWILLAYIAPLISSNDHAVTISLHISPDPSILQKVEEALANDSLSDAVFDQLLICLKEEWME